MKLFSTLLLTLAAIGAAATSSTPKVVRTANKGVESSRQLSEQGTGNNSAPTPNISRPNSYPTPNYNYGSYNSYGGSSSGGGGSSSGGSSSHSSGGSSKPHHKKPAAKKTKAPKKPKAKPHKTSSSSHSSSGGSSYHSSSSSSSSYSGYYKSGGNFYTYSAVGLLAIAGAVLAKKKCLSHGDEEVSAIDASEILEGDYENEECSFETPVTSIIEITDSKQDNHSDDLSSYSPYVPSDSNKNTDSAVVTPPEKEDSDNTCGAAMV